MAAYNPGEATVPVKIGEGRYSIDSFRGEARSYEINLTPGHVSCSCPHWVSRLSTQEHAECKHIQAVRQHIASQPAPTALPPTEWTVEPVTDDDGRVEWFVFDSERCPRAWFTRREDAEAWLRREQGQQPTALQKAAVVAQTLSDLELSQLARKHLGGAAGAACLLEMARRVRALQKSDPLQASALANGRIIDAAEWMRQDAIDAGYAVALKPTPAGVLELLQGATEAERERALQIYK